MERDCVAPEWQEPPGELKVNPVATVPFVKGSIGEEICA